MASYRIIDTYPAFLEFWTHVQGESLGRQVDRWASEYLSRWPELLAKQQADYASQDLDWRQVAGDKVFPFLNDRLPAMAEARDHLLRLIPALHRQAQHALAYEADTTFVVYVGIGCGAGWVTTYQDMLAVLIGLENIAECGWSDSDSITGLVAHELGHVAHAAWRRQHAKPEGEGAWWQLYSEGFAQCCEHMILGRDTWHESRRAGEDDWVGWCRSHRGWLAAEFLRATQAREPVHQFFGSWYEIQGYSQCGYFLGHEVIREFEAKMSLKEIALLEDIEKRCRHVLGQFAELSAPRG